MFDLLYSRQRGIYLTNDHRYFSLGLSLREIGCIVPTTPLAGRAVEMQRKKVEESRSLLSVL